MGVDKRPLKHSTSYFIFRFYPTIFVCGYLQVPLICSFPFLIRDIDHGSVRWAEIDWALRDSDAGFGAVGPGILSINFDFLGRSIDIPELIYRRLGTHVSSMPWDPHDPTPTIAAPSLVLI